MRRLWDFIVGSILIVSGLLAQLIVAGIVLMIWIAIAHNSDIQGDWLAWLIVGGAMLGLNVLIVWEFRRRTRLRALGVGGALFFLPRGWYRIWHGRESYSDALSGTRGFEVAPTTPSERNSG